MVTSNNFIRSKLPNINEVLPVFSLILFLLFSWILYRLFWHTPSWLYYLKIKNIAIIYSYALSYALFESLIFILFIIFLSLILPVQIFKSNFIAQGSAVVIYICTAAILVQRKMRVIYLLDLWELIVFPIVFLISIFAFILITNFIFKRFKQLSKWVEIVAERISVFLYIYIPVSIIGAAVVFIRNLVKVLT